VIHIARPQGLVVHETSFFEDTEMLRNCRACDREAPRDVSDSGGIGSEHLEDLPTHEIAESRNLLAGRRGRMVSCH